MTTSRPSLAAGPGAAAGKASTVGARCPAQGRPAAWARASSANTAKRAPHQPDHAVGVAARPPPVDRGRAVQDAPDAPQHRPGRPTAARGPRRWPAGRTRRGRTGRRSRRPCTGRCGPSRRCRTSRPAGRRGCRPRGWHPRRPGGRGRTGWPAGTGPAMPRRSRRPAPRPGAVSSPARSRMSMTGVPSSTSSTPGERTAPVTVTRVEPGASGVPCRRNHWGPWRAMRATWDRVSALWTTTGRRPTRSGTDLSTRSVGRAGRSLSHGHERRLLAGHVAARRAHHGGTGSGAAPARVPLGEGGLERPAAAGPLSSATQTHDLGGADHGRGHLGAVQDQVRGVGQQDPVLGAGRLTLHGVDHHHRRAARPADGVPLGAGGEARTSPAEQPGLGDRPPDGGPPLRVVPRRAGPTGRAWPGGWPGPARRTGPSDRPAVVRWRPGSWCSWSIPLEQSGGGGGRRRRCGRGTGCGAVVDGGPGGPGRGSTPRPGGVRSTVGRRDRTGTARVPAPARRARSRFRRWSAMRQASAPATASVHRAARASNQRVAASVPMPSEWAMATGQLP